jgi:hypothetical protein
MLAMLAPTPGGELSFFPAKCRNGESIALIQIGDGRGAQKLVCDNQRSSIAGGLGMADPNR